MLDTQDAEQLRALFNHFDVPIFAAERLNSKTPFKLFSLNKCFSDASGIDPAITIGQPLDRVFPNTDDGSINAQFKKCADTRRGIRFRQRLELPSGSKPWDICLQHAPLATGGDRVVAVAFALQDRANEEPQEIAFSDIAYFSALADLQLQNLISIFENAQRNGLFAQNSSLYPEHLAGLCRSIQQAVHDVQDKVRCSSDLGPSKVVKNLDTLPSQKGDNRKSVGEQFIHALSHCGDED